MSDDTDLGIVIADLWNDEGCNWHIDFDSGAGATAPWIVILEWTQEYGNAHGADRVTFTWQFYGATVDEALRDAAGWCEALAPWARCAACGGDGVYNSLSGRTICDECNGSGLDAEVSDG